MVQKWNVLISDFQILGITKAAPSILEVRAGTRDSAPIPKGKIIGLEYI